MNEFPSSKYDFSNSGLYSFVLSIKGYLASSKWWILLELVVGKAGLLIFIHHFLCRKYLICDRLSGLYIIPVSCCVYQRHHFIHVSQYRLMCKRTYP